jgi:hypothetical protein
MPDQMESAPGTKPNPDPTVATNDAVERAMKSERDYVDGKVVMLLEKLEGLAVLNSEKFISIGKQLSIAEAQRVEQKEDSKTGLDAALAAQKEAASEQNKSNTLAISKSETATSETIKKLEDLFTTKTEALADKVADLGARVDRAEANRQGASDSRIERRTDIAERRSNITFAQGLAATVVAIILLMIGIYTAVRTVPRTPAVQIVTVTAP